MEYRKKKILFVITKSNWGGAQRYVFDLATGLPTDSFQIAVAFGTPGRLAEELHKRNILTHTISSLQRDLSLQSDAMTFFELMRLFKKERPDIVHLNSSKAGAVGALAARFAHVPHIVFTAHGWPFMERRNIAWRFFAYVASWITALLSHTVIVVSKNDLTYGSRMLFCKKKMHLIYNGIRLDAPLGSGQIIRDAFPRDVKIIGTIGELTHNKNQIALIENARKNPDLFVAIVGEGEDRARLEKAIARYNLANRVKLFGFIPAQEVLRGFDVFALPSLKEGLPYVLLEAKAAGLPLIANRIGGMGEIIDAPDMSIFSLEKMLIETARLY